MKLSERHGVLGVYLKDHRAGAAGGLHLARRMLREYGGSELGAVLQEIVLEIERDLDRQ
jgi:hypothetical protein